MTELARGNYHYWHNGRLTAVTEPWTLRRGQNSLELCGQRLLEQEVLLDIRAGYRDDRCQWLELRWKPGGGDAARHYSYRQQGTELHWRNELEPRSGQMYWPSGGLFFPLLRAAAGPLVQALAGRRQAVILPNLRDPAGPKFLQPLLSQRHTELQTDGDQRGRHYRYFGGEYGEAGSDYWLNDHGLLQEYCWRSKQGEWLVRLQDIEYSAEFSGWGGDTGLNRLA